jgi:hypothetical protein
MARQVTLVVEDGTIVPDANSFVTEDQIATYALMRGVTLPNTTDIDKDKIATLGILAMDYLRVLPWKGDLVEDTQTTPWPRKNIITPIWPDNVIPPAVIEAQYQLTLLSNGGVILLPTYSGSGFLTKEKIGPIENTYSEKVGVTTNGLPLFPGISMLLDPWLLDDSVGLIEVGILSIGRGSRIPDDG